MPRLAINSAGLGADIGPVPTGNSMGQLIPYCSASWWNYLFSSGCWNYEMSAWQQMAALPTIPASVITAPVAPGFALSTQQQPVSVDEAAAAQQAASDAAVAAQQQDVSDWAQWLPDNPVPAVPCTWLNIPCAYLAIGALIAFFGLSLLGGGPVRYRR